MKALWFDFWHGQIFLFSRAYRPALRPTQCPILCSWGQVAIACSWPLTSTYCWGYWIKMYLQRNPHPTPVCLHGMHLTSTIYVQLGLVLWRGYVCDYLVVNQIIVKWVLF